MSYTAADLIAIAKAEVGYKEKASNANLDDKTANAGSANWTKYARDLNEAGYYNGNKNGFAWCCVTVDWCHYMAAGKDKAEAQRVSCQTGPLGAVCTYAANYYKAQGRLDSTPRVGDQVFFGNSDTAFDHTGIVTKVDGNTIYTIEGNASDAVSERSYKLSNKWIRAFGHPLYADSTELEKTAENAKVSTTASTAEATTDTSGTVCTVKTVVVQRGSKGPQVKLLQTCLNQLNGAGLEVDGSFGALTKTAVIAWQKACGIDQDGVVGPDTWGSIFNSTKW